MSIRLEYPKFKAAAADGTPLSGGLLYTYVAGTSTPKAAYTDKACTTPHANPIVLDTNGEALIYLLGLYKLNLTTSAGTQVTGWPVDQVEGTTEALLSQYYPDYGAADHGVEGDENTIKHYIDLIGVTNKGTIYLRHNSGSQWTDYTVSTALTIPANVKIELEHGARLKKSGSATITIISPFDPGLRQVFTGFTSAGDVTFASTSCNTVHPVWLGENTTPGTTDYYNAVHVAYHSVPDGGTLWLPPQTMAHSTIIEFDREINVIGADVQKTVFKKTTDIIGVRISSTVNAKGQQQRYRNFTVEGTNGSDTKDGIEIWSGSTGLDISNVYSMYHGGDGVHARGSVIGSIRGITSAFNLGNGLNIEGNTGYSGIAANANFLANLRLSYNTKNGLKITNTSGCSAANFGYGIVCEGNSEYGAYISDLSNILDLYTESNTLGDVYLDANSTRNYITINAMGTYTSKYFDYGTNNVVMDLAQGLYLRIPSVKAPVQSSNAAGKPLTLSGGNSGNGVTGYRGGELDLTGGDGDGDRTGSGGAGGHVRVHGGSPGTGNSEYGTVYLAALASGMLFQLGYDGSLCTAICHGTFTLNANAASTTVVNGSVKATSRIIITPTSANAAADVGSATGVYVSTKSAGAYFSLAHPNNANANKTFDYIIINP